MELQELLNQIKDAENKPIEKTAEASDTSKQKLLDALDDVINNLDSPQKTAEAASATDNLIKMAQNLATSESEALVKEAEFYGAALADGFLTRLNNYAAALPAESMQKTAEWNDSFAAGADAGYATAMQELNTPVPLKPNFDKTAFDAGYADAMALMQTPEGTEKVAEFLQGYDEAKQLLETPEGTEKVAEFLQGYDEAKQLLETPGGAEKVSEFIQGYEDGKALIEKTATAVAETAYRQTLEAISKL